MNIQDILTVERVKSSVSVNSKKRALETLSELLASSAPYLDDLEIFNNLIKRERLGSTGVGHGVGIPHGRLSGIQEAIGALIVLDNGVDYDANDGQSVDLMFAMMVPADGDETHLELLRSIAELCSDAEKVNALRAADDDQALFDALQNMTA